MRGVPFDRFVKYPELTEILRAFAAEFPTLLALSSIGRSHEGRDAATTPVRFRSRSHNPCGLLT